MSKDLQTQKLNIVTADGECDCFLAHPRSEGPYPAVLLLMDAFGPRPYLYEMCEQLAHEGYYVLLPNLFYRNLKAPFVDLTPPLDDEKMARAHEVVIPLARGLDHEAALKDIESFLAFLDRQPQADAEIIGVTGYCMGGGLGIKAAARFPDRVAAVASFHAGRLASESPTSPHLFLPQAKAEIYVAHADKDTSMPQDQIERLEEALQKSGLPYQAEIYRGAAHGFTMADLPAYNAEALERHWKQLLALFKRRL
jgi:carboxymethylenebutenolidase